MIGADDQLLNDLADDAFAAWVDAMEADEAMEADDASFPAWQTTVGVEVIDRGAVRYVRTERRAA